MFEIKIIHEPTQGEEFLIISKPAGLPSAPLNSSDTENALFYAAQKYPAVLSVQGKKEIEHGLLHRIDTATEGLIIIATTQESYNKLIQLQENGKIIKYYKAVCNKRLVNLPEGYPEKQVYNIENPITVESYFRPFGDGRKEVRPVTENSGMAALKKVGKKILYSTTIELETIENDKYTFVCKITNGFRHQVRCHLSWLGFPIIGDQLYNENATTNEKMLFTAFMLDIDGTKFRI